MQPDEVHWWREEAVIPDDISGVAWTPPIDESVAAVLDAITPALHLPGPLMDIGCGTGRLTLPIAERVAPRTVIGVDVAPRMLAELGSEATTRRVPNVVTFYGDGHALPDISPLAAAWSTLTFQHLRHDVTAGYIRQTAASLQPGGILRFQHVLGDEDAPRSHQTTQAQTARWCLDAGLTVQSTHVGLIHESWIWVTATRP